jgi:hypothetical protein
MELQGWKCKDEKFKDEKIKDGKFKDGSKRSLIRNDFNYNIIKLMIPFCLIFSTKL